MFLRDGFESEGEIHMLGARIGANLECGGAKLRNKGGTTLAADGLTTDGGVFLNERFESDGATRPRVARIFESDGEIRLRVARIRGTLACVGAKLRHPGERALALDGARIEGAFLLRGRRTSVTGAVDLTGAEISHLYDDPNCWPEARGDVVLDRCVYGAFIGGGVDAATRIAWLDRQDPARFGQDFWPQPWEQCAKVLREMGHPEDSRAVLIAKEERQRRARRLRAPLWLRPLLAMRDGALGATVGYGRSPMWAFAWLAAFWLVGAALFHDADRFGALRPNDPAALLTTEWRDCAAPSVADRTACWRATPAGRDWPAFDPLVYSLDTVLPVVDLRMARWWTPDEGAPWRFARATRVWMQLQILAGWALSLLAVAGFSGLVKSD